MNGFEKSVGPEPIVCCIGGWLVFFEGLKELRGLWPLAGRFLESELHPDFSPRKFQMKPPTLTDQVIEFTAISEENEKQDPEPLSAESDFERMVRYDEFKLAESERKDQRVQYAEERASLTAYLIKCMETLLKAAVKMNEIVFDKAVSDSDFLVILALMRSAACSSNPGTTVSMAIKRLFALKQADDYQSFPVSINAWTSVLEELKASKQQQSKLVLATVFRAAIDSTQFEKPLNIWLAADKRENYEDLRYTAKLNQSAEPPEHIVHAKLVMWRPSSDATSEFERPSEPTKDRDQMGKFAATPKQLDGRDHDGQTLNKKIKRYRRRRKKLDDALARIKRPCQELCI